MSGKRLLLLICFALPTFLSAGTLTVDHTRVFAEELIDRSESALNDFTFASMFSHQLAAGVSAGAEFLARFQFPDGPLQDPLMAGDLLIESNHAGSSTAAVNASISIRSGGQIGAEFVEFRIILGDGATDKLVAGDLLVLDFSRGIRLRGDETTYSTNGHAFSMSSMLQDDFGVFDTGGPVAFGSAATGIFAALDKQSYKEVDPQSQNLRFTDPNPEDLRDSDAQVSFSVDTSHYRLDGVQVAGIEDLGSFLITVTGLDAGIAGIQFPNLNGGTEAMNQDAPGEAFTLELNNGATAVVAEAVIINVDGTTPLDTRRLDIQIAFIDNLERNSVVVPQCRLTYWNADCARLGLTHAPENFTVCEGDEVTFSVSATGTTPTAFQWFKDDVQLPNGKNRTLTISGATSADAGQYRCVIANNCSYVDTPAGSLTVSEAPSTAMAGSDQTILDTETLDLNANTPAVGTGAWQITAGPDLTATQLSDPNSPTAVFTPSSSGTFELVWTTVNGDCVSSDTVVVEVTPSDALQFPDAILEQYLIASYDQNQNGKLSLSEVQTVTQLEIPGMGVTDMAGLRHFSALEHLNAANNRIAAIVDLSALHNLRTLNLSNNRLNGFFAVKSEASSLPAGLESLDLSMNGFRVFPNLPDLPQLTDLVLQDNRLEAVPDLSGFNALANLRLEDNQLARIEGLPTGLTKLSCQNNLLTELPAIAGLAFLRVINLSNNRLVEVPDLTKASDLTWLNLANNMITDPSPLSNNPDLGTRPEHWLDLRRNLIEDCSAFGELKARTMASGAELYIDPQGNFALLRPQFPAWSGGSVNILGFVEDIANAAYEFMLDCP